LRLHGPKRGCPMPGPQQFLMIYGKRRLNAWRLRRNDTVARSTPFTLEVAGEAPLATRGVWRTVAEDEGCRVECAQEVQHREEAVEKGEHGRAVLSSRRTGLSPFLEKLLGRKA